MLRRNPVRIGCRPQGLKRCFVRLQIADAMSTKISSIAFSVSLLLVRSVFCGGPPGFSPFPAKETPKLFPVQELKMLKYAVFGTPATGRRPPIEVLEFTHDDSGTSVEVLPSGKLGFTGRFRVSDMFSWQTVYLGDFNGDGRNDLAIVVSSGGNGIASCRADVTFLLSGQRLPKPIVVSGYCPRRDDFVDLRDDGRCQIVQTCFVFGYGEPGKDGREHNYWVYSIFRVEDDRIVLDNTMVAGFPKWVMYTNQPNSAATNQLTDKQKTKLLTTEARCGIGKLRTRLEQTN